MTHTGPWYVWAGEFLKEAMKGWGLASILVLLPSFALSCLLYTHGGRYLEANITRIQREAEAAVLVAIAVHELTEVSKQTIVHQEIAERERAQQLKLQVETLAALTEARVRMVDVAETREKQSKILEEIRDAIRHKEPNR